MLPSQKEKKLNTYLKTNIFTIKMTSLTHLLLHALSPKHFYFLILTKIYFYLLWAYHLSVLLFFYFVFCCCCCLFVLNDGTALFISCCQWIQGISGIGVFTLWRPTPWLKKQQKPTCHIQSDIVQIHKVPIREHYNPPLTPNSPRETSSSYSTHSHASIWLFLILST